MSSDIEKLAVFDSRIVQSRPKFAVEKGALSLTNAPFNAIAQTESQHTYNIYVPSENVFVDRKVLWSSTVFQQMGVVLSNAPTGGEALVVPGRDFSLCALPLNQLCSTISATINDTTTVINSQDVLREVLRLCDHKKNRQVRTAPTMLDKFASYNDAFGCLANPIGGFDGMLDYDNQPNGAYSNLFFTDASASAANLPSTSASLVVPAFAGAKYCSVNGVPTAAELWNGAPAVAYVAGNIVQYAGSVWLAVAPVAGTAPAAALWTDLGSALSYTIYFKWRTTEPVVLSPFVFSDEYEWDTGLFGLNNIQLIMNLVSTPSRIVRTCSRAGRAIAIAGIAYNANVANKFSESVINCQFLTPSLDVPLPPKSVVPYMEFPRYITQYQGTAIAPGATGQIISQTITLPCIPDLLIVYAKPSAGTSTAATASTDGDFYLPLASSLDGIRNPLSINFDNFSGLLSSTTTEQLFLMSQHNGLEMDYATFLGQAHSAGGNYGTGVAQRQAGQLIPSVGSILVLKPGQDLTLQSGQAASLVGNFTLQFNLTVKNNTTVAQTPQLYVITANSGFFESIRGSSRVIKGVLSEQDIISAPLAPMGVRCELNRMVGGFSFASLGNILSKARDIYQQTKPLVSAVSGMLPQSGMLGKLKSGAEALGYGTGAGSGGKKSLASRLM
jgi:hypothetical protein